MIPLLCGFLLCEYIKQICKFLMKLPIEIEEIGRHYFKSRRYALYKYKYLDMLAKWKFINNLQAAVMDNFRLADNLVQQKDFVHLMILNRPSFSSVFIWPFTNHSLGRYLLNSTNLKASNLPFWALSQNSSIVFFFKAQTLSQPKARRKLKCNN